MKSKFIKKTQNCIVWLSTKLPLFKGVIGVFLVGLIIIVIDQPVYNWLMLPKSSLFTEFATYNYTENNVVIVLIWICSFLLAVSTIPFLLIFPSRRLYNIKAFTAYDQPLTYTALSGIKLSIPLALLSYYFIQRFQLFGLGLQGLEFTSFDGSKASGIKHLDFISVLLLIWFIHNSYRFRHKKITIKEVEKSRLVNDTPIALPIEDELNLKAVATVLVKDINGWIDVKYAFTIGVSGHWGSGKSSLFNLVKSQLMRNPANIIMDFNAWQYEAEINLSAPFLKELHLLLKPYILNSGKNYDKYINEILQSNSQWFSKLTPVFSQQQPVNTYINSIKQSILSSGKRLIVFIDDLDRLQANEIIEIFNIIRNVGNLPNILFIVAFDKDYLLNQLKNAKIKKASAFFTKFFQVEIPMGNISTDKLKRYLVDKLQDHFSQYFTDGNKQKLTIKDEKDQMNPEVFIVYYRLMDILTTIRDIKRLINGMNLIWPLVANKVDFMDFFILEVIRLKFPATYTLLKSESAMLLERDNIHVRLKETKRVSDRFNSDEEKCHYLLNKLFPNDSSMDKKKRIRYTRHYNNYFTFDHNQQEILDQIDQIIYED